MECDVIPYTESYEAIKSVQSSEMELPKTTLTIERTNMDR
jgi:hypothetical protein